MTGIWQSIHKWGHKVDRCTEHFAFRHPYLAFLTALVGMPLFVLLAVAFCTAAVAIPAAWIFGWL